jgi:hypothetical protein
VIKSQILFPLSIANTETDVEAITDSYYDGYSDCFIFTQPSEQINPERVVFYETQIKAGLRPTALIYSGNFKEMGKHDDGSVWQSTMRTGTFIIDGHHKLMAYLNLKINPSLIRIERKFEAENVQHKTDALYELKGFLHSCQLKHIDENS